MNSIEHILSEIRIKRNCGSVTACIFPYLNQTRIGLIANFFGLKADDTIYHEVSLEAAKSIVLERLIRDAAYNMEIMAQNVADALVSALFEQLDQTRARFYTNVLSFNNSTLGPSVDFDSAGWMPATDATFDSGVIILEENQAICVWFQDED